MDAVSLFSGCGGLDLGFARAGFNIVWANDFDKFAVKTYKENFGEHIVHNDINEIELDSIPRHDILIGGFPCQPFSMMGNEMGFDDARGTLFFRVVEIILDQTRKGHKPPVVVLENVRTLRTHNGGRTFATIRKILTEDLGYRVFDTVLNTANYGIPQTRNRTYIVCFDNSDIEFEFPEPVPLERTLQDLLEHDVDDKYFLSERILRTVMSHGTGNFRARPEIDLRIARPLTATMAKMHRACQDNYVTQNGRVRRLTPRECARLQGFPDDFRIPVSDTQAYKQFGNAVTVDVAHKVAWQIRQALGW
ncbi:MAG: DNA (cytosine-5-)-methyltransferase [Peptoclostridium sp.]|uniref:DNA cytosine methyltransferase n=1 Tax=Peptoclostridium sp. TaxID=1904860 RepID=UPI00139D651B|nr:DNA (cytosine-5-)-methyltransferase [Peptoclostridium sp.]MZQ74733.1 DNA (cytosine-5-)-methyltransferase [Peptoclostridium sp.]